MRIAYFNDTYTPGINGVVVALRNLAKGLSGRNHVRLYVPAYKTENWEEKDGKVEVERYASFPVPFYKDFQIVMADYFRLGKSLKEFDPDIVHVHSPGVMGLAGMALAKRNKKPVVGTYHALLTEALMYLSPLRWIPGIDVHEATRVRGGEKVHQKAVWNILNKFYSYCQVVVAPSMAVKRELVGHGLAADVRVISNGIEMKLFPAKQEYKKRYKVLYVGRAGYEKNVDLVIKAFNRVVRWLPMASLTVVGDGPAMEDLKKLVEGLGLRGRVLFEGWVEREKLARVYRAHDVFVTASAMETQGLVILEAMSSGLPVVGIDKYAVPDVVKHGRNGYVVRPGDVKEMAKYVKNLLEDENLQERLGKNARKSVESHDVNKVIGQMEDLYKEVVARGV